MLYSTVSDCYCMFIFNFFFFLPYETTCVKSTACFLAVDHSGSFHYFSVVCRKHGEQVRTLSLHQKDMQGFKDSIQCCYFLPG